ncbi:hypothetical protein [Acidithiobacillus thiooxidans]|uniref:Uncharacterized protein n=1 Tax=Acidithiobacillus thiooxidans ATCC 19377 TaxID=637390 RepID=A0A543Q1R3_ACITH|nr:hypothetical protein [Acidithiobacillus thiooxidans]MDX5935605.1 hypothetical protein [Acidithiobacillus thiooxidans]TQN50261.1 hypothetical protein DLNHIDIE_00114 [Acidithiobacillus thiooxidans ATCC 19377]
MLRRHDESPEDFSAGIDKLYGIDVRGKNPPALDVGRLSFFGLLIDDVFAAGQYGHWAGNFWFGVGGAGFHDGLFIGPVTTLALALFLRLFGALGRRQGLFISASSSTHTRPTG